MRHKPLAAIVVAEEFCTRVEEESPAVKPAMRFGRAIEFGEGTDHSGFFAVDVFQPMAGGALVMRAAHTPMFADAQVI